MIDKTVGSDFEADEVLDTSGQLCPLPIIKTAEKVKAMLPGTILEVISTDSGMEIDLPHWCNSQGHRYLGIRREGRTLRAFLRVETT